MRTRSPIRQRKIRSEQWQCLVSSYLPPQWQRLKLKQQALLLLLPTPVIYSKWPARFIIVHYYHRLPTRKKPFFSSPHPPAETTTVIVRRPFRGGCTIIMSGNASTSNSAIIMKSACSCCCCTTPHRTRSGSRSPLRNHYRSLFQLRPRTTHTPRRGEQPTPAAETIIIPNHKV